MTAAFELLSDPARAPGLPPETRLAMMQELASASGSLGMVGGQQADIEAESAPPAAFAEEDVRFIHERKTGRLIRAAVRVGAMAGG